MEKKPDDKSFIQKHRNEILVGIITSALWYVVERIVKSAPKAGRTILGTIQNSIYSSASLMSPTYILGIVLEFIICILILIALLVSRRNRHLKETIEALNTEAKIIEEMKAGIEKEEKLIEEMKASNDKKVSESDAKEQSEDEKQKLIEGTDKESDSSLQKKKTIDWFPIIWSLFTCVLFTISVFIPLSISQNFSRDITMIKPYADNHTVLVLESEWIRMRSKDDYNRIYDVINQIKTANNLPK